MLLRFGIYRDSVTRKTYLLYAILCTPAFAIEAWFEWSARPRNGRVGDDLEAKGVTEYMFDVIYCTWGTLVAAIIFGDVAWWLWTAVPIYSVFLLVTTFSSVKEGFAGLGTPQDEASETTTSNRQRKIEKRGGQKVQYRS